MSSTNITGSQGVIYTGGSVSDSSLSVVVGTEQKDRELETLRAQVEELLGQLPAEKRAEVKEDLERFSAEARSEKPSPRYLQVSAKGLADAAEAVGKAAPPILATVKGILKLIGFASMVL